MATLQTNVGGGLRLPQLVAPDPSYFGGAVRAVQEGFQGAVRSSAEMERLRSAQRLSRLEEAQLPYEMAIAEANLADLADKRATDTATRAASRATAAATIGTQEDAARRRELEREGFDQRVRNQLALVDATTEAGLVQQRSNLDSLRASAVDRVQREELQRRIDNLDNKLREMKGQVALQVGEQTRESAVRTGVGAQVATEEGQAIAAENRRIEALRQQGKVFSDTREINGNQYSYEYTLEPDENGVEQMKFIGSPKLLRTASQIAADDAARRLTEATIKARLRAGLKSGLTPLRRPDPNSLTGGQITYGFLETNYDDDGNPIYTPINVDGSRGVSRTSLTAEEEAAVRSGETANANDLGSALAGVAGGTTPAPATPPATTPVAAPPVNPNVGYLERGVNAIRNVGSNIAGAFNQARTSAGNAIGREVRYLDRTLPGYQATRTAIRGAIMGPDEGPIVAAEAPVATAPVGTAITEAAPGITAAPAAPSVPAVPPPQLTVAQAALAPSGYFVGAENGRMYFKDTAGMIQPVQ